MSESIKSNQHKDLLWLFGIILNVTGSCTINFGTNLVQYSHYKQALNIQESTANLYSLKLKILFYLGWSIFAFGNLINFASLRFTAQTVLSALGSVQFVANILSLYILFKIPPTAPQILGTILIIIGITFILLLSHLSTYSELTVHQIYNLFKRTKYIIYLITIITLSIIFQCIYWYLKKRNISRQNESSLQNNLSPQTVDNIDLFTRTTKTKLAMAICYSFISTMLGTQSLILSKCMSLSVNTLQLSNGLTYLFFVLWIIAMVFYLYRMNTALKEYKSVFIIPLLQVLWMIFSIVCSGIFFKEFEMYQWYNFGGFIMSALVVCIGVYYLSPPTERGDVDNLLTVSTWNFMFPASNY
eukprot:555249_1